MAFLQGLVIHSLSFLLFLFLPLLSVVLNLLILRSSCGKERSPRPGHLVCTRYLPPSSVQSHKGCAWVREIKARWAGVGGVTLLPRQFISLLFLPIC